MTSVKLNLKLRYLTALLLIALLTSGSVWLFIALLEQQKSDALKINTSGLQRMLSQKIALYASRMDQSSNQSGERQILKDAIDTFEQNHQYLVSEQTNLSAHVRSLYFAGEPNLDSLVRDYIATSRKLLTGNTQEIDLRAFEISNTEKLLYKLDEIVGQFQWEAEHRVQILKNFELAVWILSLLLLALEARYIFWPMEKGIKRSITLLQQKINDIHSLHAEKQKLEEIANLDPLTGLYSLNAGLGYFQKLIDDANHNHQKLAVLFLDLDNFKLINDELGHDVGDAVLVATANRIQQELRNNDIACRIGGDEFLLVIENISDIDQLEQLCTRLLASISKPIDLNDSETQVYTSIGCAIFPEHACDANGLKKLADTAMYEAKRNGKNSFFIFGTKVKFVEL